MGLWSNSATIRDQIWMNVALRASFQISVEKLNVNQFQNLKCIKESMYFWPE